MKQHHLLRSACTILATFSLAASAFGQNTLEGRAILNAATFSNGPTSGQYLGLGPINAQAVPFLNKQPVQGFSALLKKGDGAYLGLSDNGFGSIENSADYLLRLYTIRPDFKTAAGGIGAITVEKFIQLNDADHHIRFPIVNEFTLERNLTGADFDIESLQEAADGSYWIGDEFGPFLLHVDSTGKLIEPPFALPDYDFPGKEIRSPQNPYNEEASAIRIMNAFRTHAQLNGNTKAPVFSPWSVLVDDNDSTTFVDDRKTPPSGSGLVKASSDIFNVKSLQNAGYPVVVWTVNDSISMTKLLDLGVNGIISDAPDLLFKVVATYDKNKDGIPDFIDGDGLIAINKLDAQAHRGGRNLRPENTLPSFEAGLDNLVTTLETDCGITKDGVPVLSHDPHIQYTKGRKKDGSPYLYADEVLIKELTLAQLQSTFIVDKLLSDRPNQKNDTLLSPVATAFAHAKGLIHPYVVPTLEQLFEWVDFYIAYYTIGNGKNHPDALKRSKNAARVRFNVETKYNPRTDKDEKGVIYAERTINPDEFATKVATVIKNKGMSGRADIQSFAFQTLVKVQKDFPEIRTVYLFGDFPKIGDVGDDGTNLQDQNGANTPWMAGLKWPYRVTKLQNSFRAQSSGGFEGMAITTSKLKLFPLLEKPLINGKANTLLIHEFDLHTKKYINKRYEYIFNSKGTNIGDFILFNPVQGLVIERDATEGKLDGFKKVYKVTLNVDGSVSKKEIADLLNLADPNGISTGATGDVGIGAKFAMPFTTIESVVVLDSLTILVLNDNNYPFSIGRHVSTGLPDDSELIKIRLASANKLHTANSASDNTRTGSSILFFNSYPNPFKDATVFSFSLAESSSVSITVSTLLGEVVSTLQLGNLPTGQHQVDWNSSEAIASGLYLVTFTTENEAVTTRIVKLAY